MYNVRYDDHPPRVHFAAVVCRLLNSTALFVVLGTSFSVYAEVPQVPLVTFGSVVVTKQGTTTIVNQGTEKAIIDWRTFSIGSQEAVRFDQPGRSSVTLNRVTSSEISRIDGRLSATGQVWISNPNGMIIGSGGQVNVSGLLVTTGVINTTQFLSSGRAQIDQIGKDASIVNAGSISIGSGGYAALAAAAIRNDGVIAARSGSIALGTGKAVTVDFAGDKLIQYQVTQRLEKAPAGADAAISGAGTLSAEGGTVLLSARAAKGVIDNVVNLKGLVVSNSVKVDGGTVVFGDGGAVQVSAKIDTSSATGQGGTVAVLGEKVGLMDGASIDASGATGGGNVSIGGDWQGKGPNQNALVTYVSPTASIKAEGPLNGKGGTVAVWADDTTRFNGTISALGGSVETSGKRTLQVDPAAVVKAGSWLLDPNNITINAVSNTNITASSPFQAASPGAPSTILVDTINAALGSGDVTVQTSAGTGGNGDIYFAAGTISYAGGAVRNLRLLADRDIVFQPATAITLSNAAHNIILDAGAGASTQTAVGGGISITSSTLKTAGGTIAMIGGNDGVGGTLAAVGSSADNGGIGVIIQSHSVIDAGTGQFIARGLGRPGTAQSSIPGVALDNSTLTANGGVTMIGTGGDSATVSSHGVSLFNSTLTANGGVTMNGTGGGSATASGHGVYLRNSIISASSGAIDITGHGSTGNTASSAGVQLDAMTMNLGSGATSINGQAGSANSSSGNVGVRITGASTLSGSGSLTIVGVGAGGASDSTTQGVLVDYESSVTLSDAGTLSITGTRGRGHSSDNVKIDNGTLGTAGGNLTLTGDSTAEGGGTNNNGVHLSDNAKVTTANGVISISGYGSADASANNNMGIRLENSVVSATDAGSIKLTGVRGGGSAAVNVFLVGNTITTDSGNITIDASSTALGTGNNNFGLGQVGGAISTASGTISITASGANGGAASNDGFNQLQGAISASGAGGLTIKATAGAGGGKAWRPSDASIAMGSGVATILADSAYIQGTSSFTSSTGGTISFAPLTSTTSMGLNGAPGGLQASLSAFPSGGGSVIFGRSDSTAPVTISSGAVLKTNTTFRSGVGGVVFQGAINGESAGNQSLTVDTTGGTLTAVNGVGSLTPLASLTFDAAALLGGSVTTTGTQHYSGSVTLQSNATLTGSQVTFGGAVDAGTPGSQSLALNFEAATFGSAVGAGTALNSLTSRSGSITEITSSIITSGRQSYGGEVLLAGTVFLQSNTSSVAFAGAVDSTTAGSNSLTVKLSGENASPIFSGDIGGSVAPASVGIFTTGGAVTLPRTTSTNLNMMTAGGSVGQTGAAIITGFTNIDSGGGQILLGNTANDFNQVRLGSTTNASILDSTGTLDVVGANVTGSLQLTNLVNSRLFQSGPITAASLQLGGGGQVALNDGANSVGTLSIAGSPTVSFMNANPAGLLVASVNGPLTSINIGQTSVAPLTLAGTLNNLSAAGCFSSAGDINIAGTLALGTASFAAGGTIGGTGSITVESAPLTISANGGAIHPTVAGVSGSAASNAGYINITSGSITVNGSVLTHQSPVISTPVITSVSTSQPSVASTASVTTVPIIIAVPNVPVTPTEATTPSSSSVAQTSTTITGPVSLPVAPTEQVKAIEISPSITHAVDTNDRIIKQILQPPIKFSIGILPTGVEPPVTSSGTSQRSIAATITAAGQRDTVNNTPAGALVPPAGDYVPVTGARLTSSPTVMIAPQDSAGGVPAQAIALSLTPPTETYAGGLITVDSVPRAKAVGSPGIPFSTSEPSKFPPQLGATSSISDILTFVPYANDWED